MKAHKAHKAGTYPGFCGAKLIKAIDSPGWDTSPWQVNSHSKSVPHLSRWDRDNVDKVPRLSAQHNIK